MAIIKTPCRRPGCPQLLDKPGYCPTHQGDEKHAHKDYDKKRRLDPDLSLAARIRSTSRWRKVRLNKLARNPLCEDPLGEHEKRNRTASALQVHHVKPLLTHPELAYHLDNLMSVCVRCHARIEAKVRKGEV